MKRLEKYLKKEWYRGHSDLSWHRFEGLHIIIFQIINILSHRILYQ
jgi:hypothetical protein